MSVAGETNESWNKEKEKLKLKFEAITNKYSMFEEADKSAMSGLQKRKQNCIRSLQLCSCFN
jgi:hypothetical protein